MSMLPTSPPSADTPDGQEYREAMIREAAYFRAQRRRPCVEHDIEDWLNAEREVDGMLTMRLRGP